MIDAYGRAITYLRLSVTDRCDLRCAYCMPEAMRFLPRADLLSLAELDRLASAFIRQGVRKLRLTGGEPLVRKGVIDLVASLSRHLKSGALDELTMTTNGTQLAEHAEALAAHGIERINVSLDTLDPATFSRITRGGKLEQVVAGIDAARAAGLKVKLNTVALRHDNLDEVTDLVAWAHARHCDISFIEVMPLGEVEAQRIDQHVPLTEVRARIEARWPLTDLALRTSGPARYAQTAAGHRIGFITPLSHNFCDQCNRVRLTCTGQLYLCLGQDVSIDLRAIMRSTADDAPLESTIARAIQRKPRGHDFVIAARPELARHMSVTGG
jgi:cyclic pyranopterin phosphate synthase